MAEESLDDKKIEISFSKLLFNCGAKTVAIAIATTLIVICLGFIIDHRSMIGKTISSTWTDTIDILSFNHHFWKAAITSCVSLGVLFCSICILTHLNSDNKIYIKLIIFSVLCFIFWFLTQRATMSTFESFDDLDIYQKFVVFIINAPFCIPIFLFLWLIVLVAEQDL